MSGWQYTVAVTLALAVSAGGTAISVFGFQIVRGTPLERPLGALVLIFVGMTAYHSMLLVAPADSIETQFVESAVYTTVGAFVLVMVYFQRNVDEGFVGVSR